MFCFMWQNGIKIDEITGTFPIYWKINWMLGCQGFLLNKSEEDEKKICHCQV